MIRKLLLLLVLSMETVSAEQVMEIISLQHTLVNSVLPTLRELVSPGGTVTGMNDQLIIRTDPANLADLKNVLATLDRQLRQLRISVRQDIAADSELRDDEINARFRSGEVSGSLGAPGAHRGSAGARIGIGDGDNRVEYRNLSSRRQDDDKLSHFVTTIEGQPAFINAGQVVPLADQNVVYTPYGAAVQNSVRYRDVGAGFYVTPRVVGGDGVSLEISPYAEALEAHGGGVINSRGLSTMVSGRLGEWIPLGGANSSDRNTRQGLNWRSSTSGNDAYNVWVRVEVVP